MVEKLTLNYLATALVDIPAVSMPIAPNLGSYKEATVKNSYHSDSESDCGVASLHFERYSAVVSYGTVG